MFLVAPVLRSLLLLFVLSSPALAMSGEGCGGECASCHSLTVPEANRVVGDLGKVTAVKPAAVRGLFEITLVRDGKSSVAYMDYGKKHLIGGQIFDIASRQVVGGAAPTKPVVEWIDPVKLSVKNTLVMGNPKGKQKLFVFTDPECPFCAKMHAELKKLAVLEPDLVIYIKLLPLKMHPHAYDKARVILGKRSLALLEKSFAGGKLPEPGVKDAKKPVDETLAFAEAAGIVSTPTVVLPNGRIAVGFQEAVALRKLLWNNTP